MDKNNDKAPEKKENSTTIVEKEIFNFKAPKTDLYGVYLNKDETLIIKSIQV